MYQFSSFWASQSIASQRWNNSLVQSFSKIVFELGKEAKIKGAKIKGAKTQ